MGFFAHFDFLSSFPLHIYNTPFDRLCKDVNHVKIMKDHVIFSENVFII